MVFFPVKIASGLLNYDFIIKAIGNLRIRKFVGVPRYGIPVLWGAETGECHELEASLDYRVRPCLKTKDWKNSIFL